ncbi:hypothetical protein [Paraburkholderia hospita]|uniref:hypothetical protein n=1 Tax=Paraburkholderia hospita TaxID=169430 RepID=UPI0010565E01|nr:hypothetical protein [Paraburkholderia hospita]
MFSNNAARRTAASIFLLCVTGFAHPDEKHLTLDDIDGLARQNLVNTMRKADGTQPPAGAASVGVGLNAPLNSPAPAPDAQVAAASKPPKRQGPPPRFSPPVSFVGAYSDMSGAHVLYDYQGGIYSAARGAKLLNGWVVTRVDGYHVTVSEGKRTWSEVISAPDTGSGPTGDSAAVRAVTDLGGPLPAGAPGGVGPATVLFNAR